MVLKKKINIKNKSLLNVPYYDEFSDNIQRKARYFKRYPKDYKITKKIKKNIYPNYLGRKDKTITFFFKTDSFFLLNNIYCVLNLESIKKLLIKSYPSIEKVLNRNLKEIQKPTPSLLVVMNFRISLTTINSQGSEKKYIVGSHNEIFTNLDEFCNYYEKFMRKYYLDTQYDNFFDGIHVQLIYRYAKKNNNKKNK